MTSPHSPELTAATTPRPPEPSRMKACEKLSRLRPPGESEYLREAFVHPANIAVLTLPIALAVLSQTAWILLPGLAVETAFVVLFAKLRPFRRRVDETHREYERDAAAAARAEIFDDMSDRHRREFIALENRVANIRARATHRSDDDVLGLRRLLASYLKLALTHKRTCSALRLSDRGGMSAEIERLEETRTRSSPKLRPLEERRLALTRRRASIWDRNRENLAMIETQLATVADIVQLIHERAVAPHEAETLSGDIDRLLSDLEVSEKALEELHDIGGGESHDSDALAWLAAPRPAAS